MPSIFGIDFSGSANAGQKIWIASGHVEEGRLVIEKCIRGEALPDSSRARTVCLAALRGFICAAGDSLTGLDFPLSVPRELLAGQSWLQFIRTFEMRFATPQQFRQDCFNQSPGRELKRRTDLETKTPFSPYNLRLYRQTFYGLHDVIAPLVRLRGARVLPMQERRPDLPGLIEICPASTLKWLRLYHPYKGRSSERRAERLRIVQALQRAGLSLAGHLKLIVLADPEGDALDSALAAWAAFRAGTQIEHQTFDKVYRREGYVFV